MKYLITILVILSCLLLTNAHKPPKYMNYVPYNGVNCTGPITGHGTSYLLNTCIPFESYALKYVLNGSNIESYYYLTQNCTGTEYGPSTSAVDACYRFRQGTSANPYFYSYLSVSRKAIKPPKNQLTLYLKSYPESDDSCDGDFNWSKYVTNGTTWFIYTNLTETLYCDSNNKPIELICNTTTSLCDATVKYATCDPFPQQLANLITKCKGPNPQYSSSSDSDSDLENLLDDLVDEKITYDFVSHLPNGLHHPLASVPKIN
ncbi:hypothetical protein DLAC_05009 [Tieghemostelium lacteum]|uniref:Uncharacterized protein n=1 Tax=Tieghemostelium lacteum TaxID=361077 RepID=A0A151ZI90_TIELA|nr:hypothetical protein DLAC_05009 [Tieghemostelium lacteum]|eukprot:KYQ93627.1 hypothetical protein DLAC_05009 [Tieghemostelium lacteum]